MKPLSLNKKNAFWILGICAFVLVAAGGFWWTRPPNALERATKVVTVPEWRGGKSSSYGGYLWAANGDLLTNSLDAKGGGAIFQHSSGTSRLVFKLNNNLDALIPKLEQLAAMGGWVEEVSDEGNTKNLTVRRTKDGLKRTYRLALSAEPSSKVDIRPFWSLDKKTLYYIDSGGTKLHRIRPDLDAKETLPVETFSSTLSQDNACEALGMTKSGHMVALKFFYAAKHVRSMVADPDRIEVIEAGIGTEKSFLQTNSIELSQNSNETNLPILTLSPKGDRLFLGIASLGHNPLIAWLHENISWIPEGNYQVEQGWVMNLDGSGKHLIGEFTVPIEEGKERPWIIEPKWTPDGKKISFLYDDGIYTIPAD